MKKILLLVLFIISTLSIYSQSLIGENRQWYEFESFITQPPLTFITKMEGDTLVDGNIYKKIYSTRTETNQAWTLSSGLIREDSTKKVWFRVPLNFGGSEEILLYDFDLIVGDSFAINLSNNFMCKIPVTNVDSVMLSNGEMRKRISFSFKEFGGTTDETFWIEGVGSPFGLISHLGAYCEPSDYARFLRCYFEDGERLFGQVPESDCFYLFTNTEDLDQKDKFNIYPNPVGEQFTLTLPDNQNRNWELFNYQGQVILNGQVDSTRNQISINNLPSGIYFLKIKNLGIQKVIVL